MLGSMQVKNFAASFCYAEEYAAKFLSSIQHREISRFQFLPLHYSVVMTASPRLKYKKSNDTSLSQHFLSFNTDDILSETPSCL